MSNSLIIREEQTLIEKNFSDSVDYQTLFLNADSDVSDTFLNEITNDLINKKEYNNIFIPLCFGPIMSDFNGLRLAAHIRCTHGFNQNKNIYIFSFVNINKLINHECFDILKTIGVQLIKYNFYSIQALIDNNVIMLNIENLSNEIKKLKLQVPTNYEDNHSIANEWAIHRWSQVIGAKDDPGIIKINDIQNNNLYFKYLKTINPISHLNKLTTAQLKINYKDKPKVLYVDDEAEKGWYEIFCNILYEENGIDFEYFDEEFNEKTRNEIIDITIEKIKKEDIDLVILDFRLHKDDFEIINIQEVTGYKILKKIKGHNKGIQVIIFSATNKIWNLQALQEAGADGFIMKESPENSIDELFTKQSIQNFISITEECLKMKFLKRFFEICYEIERNVVNTYSDPHSHFDNFKKELVIALKIILESASRIDLKSSSSLDVVFLNCYNFLEKFKHYYVKEVKYNFLLGFDEIEMKRYTFNNKLVDEGKFIRINISDNPTFFHSIVSILIDYFNAVNTVDITITKVYEVKESRNSYIHKNKSNFSENELIDIINICKIITINLKD